MLIPGRSAAIELLTVITYGTSWPRLTFTIGVVFVMVTEPSRRGYWTRAFDDVPLRNELPQQTTADPLVRRAHWFHQDTVTSTT